jgi:Fe-S cluster biogenesis protein NfuA
VKIDREQLAETIDSLSRLIRAHAGGIELVEVDDQHGVVTVRYTGMCVGCEFRPITTEGSVRPALLAVAGVSDVRVTGMRISAEAEARLSEALAPYHLQARATRLVNASRRVPQ